MNPQVGSPRDLEVRHEWTSYQSIHFVFPFLEDTFPYSNCILDLKIPCFIHPELLIRIFRRRIRDTSLFHLLRFIRFQKRNDQVVFIFVEFLYL